MCVHNFFSVRFLAFDLVFDFAAKHNWKASKPKTTTFPLSIYKLYISKLNVENDTR